MLKKNENVLQKHGFTTMQIFIMSVPWDSVVFGLGLVVLVALSMYGAK